MRAQPGPSDVLSTPTSVLGAPDVALGVAAERLTSETLLGVGSVTVGRTLAVSVEPTVMSDAEREQPDDHQNTGASATDGAEPLPPQPSADGGGGRSGNNRPPVPPPDQAPGASSSGDDDGAARSNEPLPEPIVGRISEGVYAPGLTGAYARGMDSLHRYNQKAQAYEYCLDRSGGEASPDNAMDYENVLSYFHGRDRERKRYEAAGSLQGLARNLLASRDTHEEVIEGVRLMLEQISLLTRDIIQVHQRPATYPFMHELKVGRERLFATTALQKINAQPKPAVIGTFLRQFIPRFAWAGIPLPEGLTVPEDYEETFRQHWSGYTTAESGYLAAPETLEAGETVLHMAFRAADAVESDGHADLAYRLRSHALLHCYAIERRGIQEHPLFPEFPFLDFIVPAAATGEIGSPPRGIPFDYVAAITRMFDQTWEAMQQEAVQGQPGAAVEFLSGLMPREGAVAIVSPYYARSLVRYANRSNLDIVATLRGLQASGVPWAGDFIAAVAETPNRPLLTYAELADFAAQSVPEEELAAEQLHDAAIVSIEELLGEEDDIYSLKLPLAEVAEVSADATATIAITYMASVGQIQAVVRHRHRGNTVTIPLRMDAATGAVQLETVDAEQVDSATLARYAAMIDRAIIAEQQRLAPPEPVRPIAQQPAASPATPIPAAPSVVSSAERVRRIKTRGTAHPSYEIVETEPTAGGQAPAVPLLGISVDSVAQLLKGAGIESAQLSAEEVVQKLRFLASTGMVTSKRPNLRDLKNPAEVRLRQLPWVAGGQQIRFLFIERPGGVLELYDIYNKKGEAEQRRHYQNVLHRIARNDRPQKQQAQQTPKPPRRKRK